MLDCNVQWKKKTNKQTVVTFAAISDTADILSHIPQSNMKSVCTFVWTNLFFQSAFSKSVVVVDSAAMLNFIYSVTNPSSILFCVLVVCLLCIVARKINRTNKTNKQTYTPHPQKSYALKYASSITIHVHRRRPSPVRPARHLPAVVPPAEKGVLT